MLCGLKFGSWLQHGCHYWEHCHGNPRANQKAVHGSPPKGVDAEAEWEPCQHAANYSKNGVACQSHDK